MTKSFHENQERLWNEKIFFCAEECNMSNNKELNKEGVWEDKRLREGWKEFPQLLEIRLSIFQSKVFIASNLTMKSLNV